MGLASGAGSVALPFIWRKGIPFEAMTGHATKCPLGFPGFSSVVRQMPGNLLHHPWCLPHSIITLIIFPSATDQRDTCN